MAFAVTHLPRRTLRATLLGLGVALLAFVALSAFAPARGQAAACDYADGLGTFKAGVWPGACWRPYGPESPFNRPVPAGAPSMNGSEAMIDRLRRGGPVNDIVAGDPERDGGNAIYWAQPTDPVYKLNCVKPWGRCMIEGMEIHVPAEAKPTGGFATPSFEHDAHMTIVDQRNGWEYDLWNVNSKSNGTIHFGWGGRTRIDGDGLGSDAVAARYGNLAGTIRIAELRAGQIDHALVMGVPCTETYVYPALQTGYKCSDAGLPIGGHIPMGAHLQLRMSEAEIQALQVPAWKKAIVRAMSRYGAYVSDTTGVADQYGFEVESAESYTSFGYADPLVAFARQQGLPREDFNGNGFGEYWMNVEAGIPWDRLRVVAVCAAEGTCPQGEEPPPGPGTPPVTGPDPGPGVDPGPGTAPRPNEAAGKRRALRTKVKKFRTLTRTCWKNRRRWATTYRRNHHGVDRRYYRIRRQRASTCRRFGRHAQRSHRRLARAIAAI